MVSVVVCLCLGLVLVAAAGLKAAGGPSAQAAFATYGLKSPQAMKAAWAGVIAAELALGVLVATGSTAARARPRCSSPPRRRRRSRRSPPAGRERRARASAPREGSPRVSGPDGRPRRRARARAAAPAHAPTTEEWLTIGLAAALLGLAALSVVVLALASSSIGASRTTAPPRCRCSSVGLLPATYTSSVGATGEPALAGTRAGSVAISRKYPGERNVQASSWNAVGEGSEAPDPGVPDQAAATARPPP